METTTGGEPKSVTKELAKSSARVGTSIGDAIEAVGTDVARELVLGGNVVLEATKSAVADVAEATRQMGRDTRQAVSPQPVAQKRASSTNEPTATV
jgi:hypothetical protein